MIFQGKAVSVALQADGIAELTLDLAGEPVNKLDRLTLDELRQALDALKATAGVRALLIASAKPTCAMPRPKTNSAFITWVASRLTTAIFTGVLMFCWA